MRHHSPRRRAREAEARPVREELKAEVQMCEVCLRHREPHLLACHEILNGPLRQQALDKRYAILVVCREPNFRTGEDCHRTVQNEPEARQLARLYLVRQHDYDLRALNYLVNPRAPDRITQDEVDAEIESLLRIYDPESEQPKGSLFARVRSWWNRILREAVRG